MGLPHTPCIGPSLETQDPQRRLTPFSSPLAWGSPCSPSSASQGRGPIHGPIQTCDWLVVDSPANAGCGAAPGRTAKPQPVPEAQAAVPRQGGEDGQCQDGEVHTAAGAARGVLGRAGVGAGIPALWAKGGIGLRTASTPSLGPAGARGASSPGRQSELTTVAQVALPGFPAALLRFPIVSIS